MAHRSLSFAAILAAALALGCGTDRTAIVLEAMNESSEPLDDVVFRVSGPGLDNGAREATAPVSGPDARSFPLTLVLVDSSASMSGPYQVTIEGRHAGQSVAQAVRTDGTTPVAFSPGKVVHFRFALRPLASTASTPPPTMPPPEMPPPEMPPPMPPPDAGACAMSDTCTQEHPCVCAAGCACRFTCGPDHCKVRCEGAGTSCEVEATGAHMADVDCAGGAACVVRGSGEKKELHFGCPGGKPLECGDDTQVCNRLCP
jgi:hypothetical protein